MALKKSIMTEYNIPCEYWMVAKVDTDKFAKQGYIVVYGFINKEIRDIKNSLPLCKKEHNVYPLNFDEYFSIEAIEKEGQNQYQQAYMFLKNQVEDFKDAEYFE